MRGGGDWALHGYRGGGCKWIGQRESTVDDVDTIYGQWTKVIAQWEVEGSGKYCIGSVKTPRVDFMGGGGGGRVKWNRVIGGFLIKKKKKK